MREAAEPIDDFKMQAAHLPLAGPALHRRQGEQEVQAALLVLKYLAVLERQIKEQAPRRRHLLVEAALQSSVRRRQRQRIAGEGSRCRAEDVARHLVQ